MINKEIKTPYLTVDIIIELAGDGIVLIERRRPPHGWAIPGGFVDIGESVEEAGVREAKEETGLDVDLIEQLHVYSAPDRDPRFHAVSVVFVAKAEGEPVGGDDAARAKVFTQATLPVLAFDHAGILKDYFKWKGRGAG